MEDIVKKLFTAADIDEYLQYIMRELEHCDDVLYGENLSATHFIYWKTRKEAFEEMRDKYCEMKK